MKLNKSTGEKFILVIDQGTTSTRSCLISTEGLMIAQSSLPFQQHYPQPGWVEHDAEEIWKSVLHTMKSVLEKAQVKPEQVATIGLTNQRETVVAWDPETGKPLHKAIVWQCRRTAKICEGLKRQEKKLTKITGLLADPYFSATKIQWLIENVPTIARLQKNDKVHFGTMDSFLIFKLTGGKTFATDVSNASRTMLMDLNTLKWSPELLKLFKTTAKALPEIKASNAHFGMTSGLPDFPDGVCITGVLGDQQAALFGQAGFAPGEVKCTFGTGSFILFNTGIKKIASKARLLTTVAWQLEKTKPIYAIEGGAFVCGAAVQWLRDGLGVISRSSEVEELALTVPDSGGVEFVPALTGLGAPYWNPHAKGVISGITRGTTKAHLARATLEAMALQNLEIIIAMEKDTGRKTKALKVDGGATANSLLLQIQSDYLGAKVIRPQELETTAFGAGLMAGLGAGIWKNLKELEVLCKSQRSFTPKMRSSEVKKRLVSWRRAVNGTGT